MPIVECKCTNCGAVLKVDSTHDAAICEFCKTPFIVQKAINNFNTVNNISDSVVNIYGGNSQEKTNLIKRMLMFVEEGKREQALEYSERVLDLDPECAEAYLCKLLIDYNLRNINDLEKLSEPFYQNENYIKIIKYSDELGKKVKQANLRVQKEKIYNDALILIEKTGTPSFEIERKKEAIKLFESIIDWKDSRAKIDKCNAEIERLKITEEKAEAERKRSAEEARIAAQKAKTRNKKIAVTGASIAAALIVFLIILNTVIIPKQKLNKAMGLLDAGNYDEAYEILNEIGNKDAVTDSMYARATEYLESKDYDSAYALLNQLGDTEKINESMYNRAVEFVNAGDKLSAYMIFAQIPGYKDSDSKAAEYKPLYIKNLLSNAKVGDKVIFGSYEQDNDTNNGKEEIEWRVLAKEGNKILVISEYALDCQRYNKEFTSVTWETCPLRKWLNETFFKSAFSAEEQKMIPETKVTADANPSFVTDPGNDTTDKVFLLSVTEAEKYFSSDEGRKCVPTAYAIEQGAYTSSSYTKGGKAACRWWLRSPGTYSPYAALVYYDGGDFDYRGDCVNISHACVRPALWIEI